MTRTTTSSGKVWLAAARPRTLALVLASTSLGVMLATAHTDIRVVIALLNILTAVLLQVLSNLANDYGDFRHGADSATRAGPQRAVQSGRVTAEAMRRAIALVAGLSMLSGLALIWLSFGAEGLLFVLLFLVLGAAAIWAAIAYTASSNPYGYIGLGDLFVFVFFGPVAVAGSYYLQTHSLPASVLLPGISAGLFAVAVLNVNNIRDIESDRVAGKNSIPVRLGPYRARLYHWSLLLGGLLSALFYVLLTFRSPWQFLFLLSLPMLLRNGQAVWRGSGAEELDPLLKQMSISTLLFVVTFSAGHLLAY